jgi:hypothetical protein
MENTSKEQEKLANIIVSPKLRDRMTEFIDLCRIANAKPIMITVKL